MGIPISPAPRAARWSLRASQLATRLGVTCGRPGNIVNLAQLLSPTGGVNGSRHRRLVSAAERLALVVKVKRSPEHPLQFQGVLGLTEGSKRWILSTTVGTDRFQFAKT